MSLWATKEFPLRFDWKFFFKNIAWIGALGGLIFWGKNTLHIINYPKLELLPILLAITGLYVGLFALLNRKEGKIFFEQLKNMRRKKAPVTQLVSEEALEDSTAE